jgi:hypothetical protein
MIPSLIPSPADHISPVHGSMIMEKCVLLSLKHLLSLARISDGPCRSVTANNAAGASQIAEMRFSPRTASLVYTIILEMSSFSER